MALSDEIRKKIQKQAMETTMKLMADERTRPYVTKAMQGFMESRTKADAFREDLLTQLGLASRDQLKAAQKEARKLGKRIDALQQKLDALSA